MTFHCKISKHGSRGGNSLETNKRAARCAQTFTSFVALAQHLSTVHRVAVGNLQELARQYREEQSSG